MKTPIQIMYDIVNNLHTENIIDYTTKMLLIEELDDLLELEKNQIIEAWNDGWESQPFKLNDDALTFYNQKYNDGNSTN